MKKFMTNNSFTAFFLTVVAIAGLAYAQNTSVYRSQGGDAMYVVSGGSLTVTGVLDASGASASNVRLPAGSVSSANIASLDTSKISGVFAASMIPNLDTSKVTTGVFADARIPSFDTSKITSGAFLGSVLAAGIIDTTKLVPVVTPATGTLLCYTDDGKIGKVTAAVDTGKTGTCEGF